MIRTNTTDALTTTAAILFVIALFTGNDSTGLDWVIRAACPARVQTAPGSTGCATAPMSMQ